MIYEPKFNPETDIAETDPFGFVDVHDALINNCVPSTLAIDATRFNEIDVDSCGNYIRDSFDALDAGRDLNKKMVAANSEARAKEE